MTLLLFVGGLVALVAGRAAPGRLDAFGNATPGFRQPLTVVTPGATTLRLGGG
jgi:hypothetical protein